jgi:hypothetical protein
MNWALGAEHYHAGLPAFGARFEGMIQELEVYLILFFNPAGIYTMTNLSVHDFDHYISQQFSASIY